MDFDYRAYYDLVDPQYISWDFYRDYITREPNFGTLGLMVYLRTYSRFIPELKRREKFCETILRVVEYSMSLDNKSSEILKAEEARGLFRVLFDLQSFTAGRTMWRGNKNDEDATANFNCSLKVIDSIESFVEIMYLLMAGAGTGFSVENKHVSKLPLVKYKPVVHSPYFYISDNHLEDTTVHVSIGGLFGDRKTYVIDAEKANQPTSTWFDLSDKIGESDVTIIVGDSREGWVTALGVFLRCFVERNIKSIQIKYDYVRPKGRRLKRMGGRASGPGPLKFLFTKIQWIIYNRAHEHMDFLSSVDAMDIANAIGEVIVVGGVRRTAQIALGDLSDHQFMTAKYKLWQYDDEIHGQRIPDLIARLEEQNETIWDVTPSAQVLWKQIDELDPKFRWRNSRVMSNNSVMVYHKPSKEAIEKIFKFVITNGEPGFINAEQGLRRRNGEFDGVNPCAEILLRDRGTCNLVEVPLVKFVIDGELRWEKLENALWHIVRHNSRITNVNLWHPGWNKVQKEDRLLGVSLTGIVEAFNALGWEEDSNDVREMYARMHTYVRVMADYYHDHLGIPRSKLITTIKPSGTISQLPTCSSGIHAPYAPYYFRRIRVAANDPIAPALKDLGVPVSCENGQGDDLEKADTWVFKFPVKTEATVKSVDESAMQQLERYKSVMDYYCDHNCSITIMVDKGLEGERPDQVPDVVDWLDANWDHFVGVSFLPRFDPSHPDPGEMPFPNPPYETCSKEQYEQLSANMPQMSEEQFLTLIAKYEQQQDEEIALIDASCSTGACPSR